MSDILIYQPCADDAPYLLWGTVWDPIAQTSDWATANLIAPGFTIGLGAIGIDGIETDIIPAASNAGGLAVGDPIATAIIIGLFTDKRCPPDHPLAKYVDGDPRGWFGDGVDVRADLYEKELGSLLWLLERATATEDNRRWAEVLAYDGLSPLLDCGAARLLETSATLYAAQNAITLDIRLAGTYAGRDYDQKFAQIWTSRT